MIMPNASGCSVPIIPIAASVSSPTATFPLHLAMYGSSRLSCVHPRTGFDLAGVPAADFDCFAVPVCEYEVLLILIPTREFPATSVLRGIAHFSGQATGSDS